MSILPECLCHYTTRRTGNALSARFILVNSVNILDTNLLDNSAALAIVPRPVLREWLVSKKLIYHNPFFSRLLRFSGALFLKCIGWRIVNSNPDIPKYVLIAAPHTSNWDFPIFLSSAGVLRIEASFLAKHTLFKGAFGGFFYWCGGIPVERGSGKGSQIVEQAVEAFKSRDQMILVVAPEGTRSSVKEWKTGFHRIAHRAGVPVVPAYVDASTKTIGFGPAFQTTDSVEDDMAALQDFYRDKRGVKHS